MNREEKALRIAELEGWKKSSYRTSAGTPVNGIIEKDRHFQDVNIFSTFNGLMEIVFRERAFEIETDKDPEFNTICVNKDMGGSSIMRVYCEKIKDPIDALQDAIIFYHENKQVKK